MHIPTWNDFPAFLEGELDILTKYEIRQSRQNQMNAPNANVDSRNAQTSASNVAQNNLNKLSTPVRSQQSVSQEKAAAPEHMQCTCTLCDDIHVRFNCPVFVAMGFVPRWRHVYSESLCKKCMHRDHGHTRCKNRQCNENCPTCFNADSRKVVAYHDSQLCPIKFGLTAGYEPPRPNYEVNNDDWD